MLKIEDKIAKLIQSCPEYQVKNEILKSMKGFRKIAAASLSINLLELGYMNNKQASALIGVAPINKDSGDIKVNEKYKDKDIKCGLFCLWL
jgi:transposase